MRIPKCNFAGQLNQRFEKIDNFRKSIYAKMCKNM